METAANAGVQAVLARYADAGPDGLIPILQEVQEVEGFISRAAVVAVAGHLAIPASRIYGVATFYNQFRFEPLGRFHVQVCRGTACHVKGSSALLEALKRRLKIEPGQTTRDGRYSLEVVACLGACGLAPVIAVNGEFHGGVTPDSAAKILEACEEQAAAVRGQEGGVR